MNKFFNYEWLTPDEKLQLENCDAAIDALHHFLQQRMKERQVLRMRANRRKHRKTHADPS